MCMCVGMPLFVVSMASDVLIALPKFLYTRPLVRSHSIDFGYVYKLLTNLLKESL